MRDSEDEPQDRIRKIESEMRRLLHHFFYDFPSHFPISTFGGHWRPSCDVYETENHLVINVEIAGIKKEEVEIFTKSDNLVIRGVRKEDSPAGKISYHQMEINYGPFELIVPLIIPIDQSRKIDATLNNGILHIRLPKAKEEKIHHIRIDTEKEK